MTKITQEAQTSAQQLQSLLDDCHHNGATHTTCNCSAFATHGACDHIEALKEFKGFYKVTKVQVGISGPGKWTHSTIKAVRYIADKTAILARLTRKLFTSRKFSFPATPVLTGCVEKQALIRKARARIVA